MNSPIVNVLEGLKVFGHPKSHFSLYWDLIRLKHFDSRDAVYWQQYGKHLPRKGVKLTARSKGRKPKKRSKLHISDKLSRELLTL